MKNFLILTSVLLMNSLFASNTLYNDNSPERNKRICDVAQDRLSILEKDMKVDKYSIATLKQYTNQKRIFCRSKD